jgi:hypothetical protein
MDDFDTDEARAPPIPERAAAQAACWSTTALAGVEVCTRWCMAAPTPATTNFSDLCRAVEMAIRRLHRSPTRNPGKGNDSPSCPRDLAWASAGGHSLGPAVAAILDPMSGGVQARGYGIPDLLCCVLSDGDFLGGSGKGAYLARPARSLACSSLVSGATAACGWGTSGAPATTQIPLGCQCARWRDCSAQPGRERAPPADLTIGLMIAALHSQVS